jgi:hypothetical protein
VHQALWEGVAEDSRSRVSHRAAMEAIETTDLNTEQRSQRKNLIIF